MNTDQRGAASLGIALAISVSMGGILLLFSLITPFEQKRDANTINANVRLITQAATLIYQHAVMRSRCLSYTSNISLQALINKQYVPVDINHGLWRFETRFISLNINNWSRPSQIETRVTFTTLAEMHAVLGHLTPTQIDLKTLVFASPLWIDVTDNWSHFDKQTGCYE